MQKYSSINQIGHIFETDSQVVTDLVIPAGKTIPTHHAPYDVLVIPIKDRIIFRGEGFEEEIAPGSFIKMTPDEPHSLEAKEDSEVFVVKSVLAKD